MFPIQLDLLLSFFNPLFTGTVALVVIINPIVNAAVFQDMVPEYHARQSAVSTASKIAAIILAVFAVAGSWILSLIGVSIEAFRVAGGVLLLRLSLSFITGEEVKTKAQDVAVVPMATPLLAGPGAISTTILLTFNLTLPITLAAVILASIISWVIMKESERLVRRLGRRGVLALGRVVSMLIAGLAIEFIFTGIVNFFHLPIATT